MKYVKVILKRLLYAMLAGVSLIGVMSWALKAIGIKLEDLQEDYMSDFDD